MKKLYQNIENVHILGGIGQLTELVQRMDVSLQNIADSTDRLTEYLLRFSGSNSGRQFEKMVAATVRLRDQLFEDAESLNDMQNQIVAYQNKLYRYEGIADHAPPPNPFLASKRQINVDTTQLQFHRAEMVQLIATLKNYASSVWYQLRSINDRKAAAGQIWRDAQYRDFSAFVDDVTRKVQAVLREYDDYVRVIEEKIKEMD